jgi:pyruvate,water dikinase
VSGELSTPLTLWFSDVGRDARPLVGGKVASLGELLRAGCRVPNGYAVTSAAYRHFIEATGLDRLIQDTIGGLNADDVAAVDAASQKIQQAFLNCSVPAELADPIRAEYERLADTLGDPAPAVAVRSSAVAEDTEAASFAGQHDTYLWVQGADEVLDAVLRCWASAFTPRAIAYRAHQRIGLEDAAVAVGVQQMVDPRAAGVMFTLSPRSGDPSLVVVEGSWGPGVAVVGGEVTPDEYWVNKVTLEITRKHISCKSHQYKAEGRHGDLRKVEVPEDRQNEPCLTGDEVVELAKVGRQLERHYGHALDIEWAVADSLPFPENIFILQARPETVWSQRRREPVAAGFTDPLSFIVRRLANT